MKNICLNSSVKGLLSILFCFFVMGFVDVVSIATSYVQQDFALNDSLANLLPMMVFLWFAVCSLPVGFLMNKIGRKKTVMLSIAVTMTAMLVPLINYSFAMVLVAFALLGIGNTILQVSLNPLVMDVVRKDRITSMLTFGQFIKAISSTLGPVIVGGVAGVLGNWKLIFVVYAVVTVLSWLWLYCVNITEANTKNARTGLNNIVNLMCNRYILMLFSMILLIVGFEIGLMTTLPKYLLEQYDIPIERGGLTCSLYFIARTIATFGGAIILAKVSSRKFLIISMLGAILSFGCFLFLESQWLIFTAVFFVGLFCSNVFAVAFSAAIQSQPDKANDISAFMIMGVAGGALIPPIMGGIADVSSHFISLFVPLLILVYLLVASFKLNHSSIK